MTAVARLLTPCFLVLGCETLVDWLKHAFITKFNQIRPSVYGRFVDILSRDLVVGSPARLAGRNNVGLPFGIVICDVIVCLIFVCSLLF
jgi:hypothetical protein